MKGDVAGKGVTRTRTDMLLISIQLSRFASKIRAGKENGDKLRQERLAPGMDPQRLAVRAWPSIIWLSGDT
jgi:hypothetical protein